MSRFKLGKVVGGKSIQEQLETVELITGTRPEELEELECYNLPIGLDYLWEWFCQLSNRRTVGMTVNPISWLDIAAWQAVTGNNLMRWELTAITRVDAEFLKIINGADNGC